jgi:hypothetical protein
MFYGVIDRAVCTKTKKTCSIFLKRFMDGTIRFKSRIITSSKIDIEATMKLFSRTGHGDVM